MAPVAGMPPNAPDATDARPWPTSSRGSGMIDSTCCSARIGPPGPDWIRIAVFRFAARAGGRRRERGAALSRCFRCHLSQVHRVAIAKSGVTNSVHLNGGARLLLS